MAGAHRHDGPAAGHSHGVAPDADSASLAAALALIVSFMAVEVAAGIAASSLALLSDAAHMLSDAAALAVALVAARLARRPARGALTYGYRRAEVLSAQFNGATLLVLGLLIVVEGIRRLVTPPAVQGTPVLVVALVGIGVNVVVAWILSRANRESINVRGALAHVITDIAAFAFTALAGLVIIATGFRRVDGIASVVIAAIMLRAAYSLLRASGRVFLEAAPEGVDPNEIGTAMAGQAGIREVHDLHVWEVSSGFPALSAHVLVTRERDCHAARRELAAMLHERFAIDHTTLQVDHEGGELLHVRMPGTPDPSAP